MQARWLAERGFGRSPQDVELALKAQEGVDVDAFAAFAAKYLPTEMLDEMILCVEATIEDERALPQGWTWILLPGGRRNLLHPELDGKARLAVVRDPTMRVRAIPRGHDRAPRVREI